MTDERDQLAGVLADLRITRDRVLDLHRRIDQTTEDLEALLETDDNNDSNDSNDHEDADQ